MSTLREGDEVLFKGTVLKIGIHGTEVQVQFGDGERFKTSVGWIPAHCVAEAALRAETPTFEPLSVNQKWLLDAAKQVIKELGASEELDSDTFRWLKDAIYYVEKEVANEARAETPAPREPQRWANTGPNGEMCKEPQGEFVLWRDVKRQVEPSSPFDMLRAAGEPEQAK